MQTIEGTGVRVTLLGEHVGAEISGVDLSRPLDDATFETVLDAWMQPIRI